MAFLAGYPAIEHMVDLLVNAARLVEKVHHTPGNIKLRISLFDLPRFASLISGLDVAEEANGVPGILSYRVHVLSTSATITYDPEIIPFDFWETFCRIRTEPQAENLFKTRLIQLIHTLKAVAAAQN